MNQPEKKDSTDAPGAEYEAPRIESIFTSEDLEREVHYAGLVVSG